MKKVRLLILSALLILLLPTLSMANNNITIMLNGSKLKSDVSPRIMNNRILVPVRVITENMGAEVQWDGATSTATITTNDVSIELVLNSNSARVNGKPVKLDQSVISVNNRILVPIRFISENMGARVDWNPKAKTAIIENGTSYSASRYNSSDEDHVIKDLNEFKKVYGQPLREENGYSDGFGDNIKTLYYDFGEVDFVPYYNSDAYTLADVTSTKDLIGTPRGVKIGDSVQSVMGKFHNDGKYDLYEYEPINARILYMTDDSPISAGLVKYNSKDQVESLEYYTGFFTGGGNSVIFKFTNGKVSSITLSYGYM